MPTNPLGYSAEYMRKRRAQIKEDGARECRSCLRGLPRTHKHSTCRTCLRREVRARRAREKAGTCKKCGHKRQEDGTALQCSMCYEKQRDHRRRLSLVGPWG